MLIMIIIQYSVKLPCLEVILIRNRLYKSFMTSLTHILQMLKLFTDLVPHDSLWIITSKQNKGIYLKREF